MRADGGSLGRWQAAGMAVKSLLRTGGELAVSDGTHGRLAGLSNARQTPPESAIAAAGKRQRLGAHTGCWHHRGLADGPMHSFTARRKLVTGARVEISPMHWRTSSGASWRQ